MKASNTVLLVDNDYSEKVLVEYALKELGDKVELLYQTGARASLEYLGSSTILPGFILADINMPGIDGLQLLEILKQHPTFSKIPVVMYSSSNLAVDIAQAQRMRAYAYIIKPSNTQQLAEALDAVIKSLQGGTPMTSGFVIGAGMGRKG